jgi:hypothetical protein
VTAVAAISVAISCSREPERQASRVCVDSGSRVVPQQHCEQNASGHGGAGYFWYYHGGYLRGGYPRTGTLVASGGTYVNPKAAPVARGGFGATANSRSVSS